MRTRTSPPSWRPLPGVPNKKQRLTNAVLSERHHHLEKLVTVLWENHHVVVAEQHATTACLEPGNSRRSNAKGRSLSERRVVLERATYRTLASTARTLQLAVPERQPAFMAIRRIKASAVSRNGANGADILLDSAGTAIASSVLLTHDGSAVRIPRRLS